MSSHSSVRPPCPECGTGTEATGGPEGLEPGQEPWRLCPECGWDNSPAEDEDEAEGPNELLTRSRIPWGRFERLGGDIRALHCEARMYGDTDLARRAARALARRGRHV